MSNRDNSIFEVDSSGHYGKFGGRYAPEVLIPALTELEDCFKHIKLKDEFLNELSELQRSYIGRPTPLTFCENLSRQLGGAKIYLKNEGACLTGAHKINHCVGQILLAKHMGKKRIIAETGAGQHGLATASVCAKFGMECVIYMGAKDVERQRPNVFWMELLGAKVIPVKFGGQRLKDAVNAAIKDWISNVQTTHYLLGSVVGSHPFPEINRFFQKVVGQEIRKQVLDKTGCMPDYVIACVGGGSNSIGAFDVFLSEPEVNLIGVEAGGIGDKTGENACRMQHKKLGVVEGFKSYWLLDENRQVADTHSISAGLDYAGIGPLHAYLSELKRVKYTSRTDSEALQAIRILAREEGIIPAIESAHALSEALELAPTLKQDKTIVVNLSGRGDKDMFILAKSFDDGNFKEFLRDYATE